MTIRDLVRHALRHRPDHVVLGEVRGAEAPNLPKQSVKVRHMPALPYREVPAAIAADHASRGWIGAKLAFEFQVLTVARSAEVRLATWDEFDFGAMMWTVPDTRMKAQREYRVPLCGRAVEILREAARLSPAAGDEPTGLVFPSRRGKALSEGGISKLVKLLSIAAVPHGFRSSFRDWAAEQTNQPREVIEAALAHVAQNRVEAAYARSDVFERRRVLMNDWPSTSAKSVDR